MLADCGLKKPLIFDGLSLYFFVKFENGMPEFINDHFFVVDEFQIDDFRDFNFHHLIVLGNNFEVTRLQTVFERIKREAMILFKLRAVKDFISLGFDDQGRIFLVEHEIIDRKMSVVNVARSSFHGIETNYVW